MIGTLVQLAVLFFVLGMLSIGGGNAILADMQAATVHTHGWMTDKEFLDIFALSRAAPGPGTLVVALIGLKAAGLAGAVVAFLAMFAPPFGIMYGAARAWRRARGFVWYAVAERGLAPIAIGFSFAGGLVLLQAGEFSALRLGITAAATAVLALTETHPMLVMLAGAGLMLAAG